jgi:hypothetical protein
MDKVLELNLKAVEGLVEDSAACNRRPRMTASSLRKQVDTIGPILRCLNSLLDEKAWREPLEELATTTEGMVWFSHPEVLSLALCSLIAGGMHGNTFFAGLEVSMKTVQRNVRISDGALHNLVKDSVNYKKHSNHAWNVGELGFTISHSLSQNSADSETDFAVNEVFDSLRQVLQWVGGTLRVESVSEKSLLLYHISLPFRSMIGNSQIQPSLNKVISATASQKSLKAAGIDSSSRDEAIEKTVLINDHADFNDTTCLDETSSVSLLSSSVISIKPSSSIFPLKTMPSVGEYADESSVGMLAIMGRLMEKLNPFSNSGSNRSTRVVHPLTSSD